MGLVCGVGGGDRCHTPKSIPSMHSFLSLYLGETRCRHAAPPSRAPAECCKRAPHMERAATIPPVRESHPTGPSPAPWEGAQGAACAAITRLAHVTVCVGRGRLGKVRHGRSYASGISFYLSIP